MNFEAIIPWHPEVPTTEPPKQHSAQIECTGAAVALDP